MTGLISSVGTFSTTTPFDGHKIKSAKESMAVFTAQHSAKETADVFERKLPFKEKADAYREKLKAKNPKMSKAELDKRVAKHAEFLEKNESKPVNKAKVDNNASRKQSLVNEMVDEKHKGASTFNEHLQTLNPKDKQVALDEMHKATQKADDVKYVTSKDKKENAKQSETKSITEHKKERIAQTKINRDRAYCTQNDIMNTEARKAYEKTAKQLHAPSSTVAYSPENIFANKSAEDSAKVFMENGLAPKTEAKKVANEAAKVVEETAKNVAKETKAVVEETAKDVAKETEAVVKEATKGLSKKGKLGIILSSIGAIGLGIGAYFKSNNPEAESETKAQVA